MESAQPGETELKRLDQIHLKAMRKIRGYKTTYVDREKTTRIYIYIYIYTKTSMKK